MKEKAIASTAVFDRFEDTEDFGMELARQGPRSRASSYSCGLGGRVVMHARRMSRNYSNGGLL